jgi:peptide/nickel transport system substrate-binding protein
MSPFIRTTPPQQRDAGCSFSIPIDRDGTNEMVNRAVKGWEAKSDKVWRYYIRPGMKFWNGNKLTAKSFAFTQNLVIDPKFVSPQRNLYSQVEKAVVVDEYTVDVICKEPIRPSGGHGQL